MEAVPSGPGSRPGRKRSKNWEPWEVYLLIQAKKVEWERYEASPARDRYSENSAVRWKKIEEYMKLQHVNRDSSACKNRWDATVAEYKLVKDWDLKPGNPPFVSLSPQERKQSNLPTYFDTKSRELLDSFLGSRVYKAPPHSLPFPLGADGDDKEAAQLAERSAGAKDEQHMGLIPARVEDRDDGSSLGKKRRKGSQGLAGVMAAFQDLSSGIIRIEKENSCRAREAHEMAKDAHELEKQKFEFQVRRMEREDQRTDKFVGVLSQIAEAFHKVADKM